MTPIILLKGALTLSVVSLCWGQAEERWSWDDANSRRGGQYTVAKTLVARREPSNQPLFQLARDPLKNKARYEVLEEGDKGLGSFINRPDRFPDDRGPFPGNNPGFDRPRPGIDQGRPGFGDRRPGLPGFNPDFNPNRPELGVARPILPGDRPDFRPDFNRPDLNNNRPFQGNRPQGFDGNRPDFGGFRPDFDNRRPNGERPPPGFNGRPKPPTGGSAPGILTGPVPSWEKGTLPHGKKDPTDFDSCKCKHSFNCKSPGIQFGTCDVGKQYCCYNSPKYGLTEGDGRRPVLIGPGLGPDHIEPRGRDRHFNP